MTTKQRNTMNISLCHLPECTDCTAADCRLCDYVRHMKPIWKQYPLEFAAFMRLFHGFKNIEPALIKLCRCRKLVPHMSDQLFLKLMTTIDQFARFQLVLKPNAMRELLAPLPKMSVEQVKTLCHRLQSLFPFSDDRKEIIKVVIERAICALEMKHTFCIEEFNGDNYGWFPSIKETIRILVRDMQHECWDTTGSRLKTTFIRLYTPQEQSSWRDELSDCVVELVPIERSSCRVLGAPTQVVLQ